MVVVQFWRLVPQLSKTSMLSLVKLVGVLMSTGFSRRSSFIRHEKVLARPISLKIALRRLYSLMKISQG